MALQRYDVRDHVAGDGAWIEKFWAPVNTPVFGGDSREITPILHCVTDMTQAVRLRQLTSMLPVPTVWPPVRFAIRGRCGCSSPSPRPR